LNIQNLKLEGEQKDLIAKRESINAQIAANTAKLKEKETALATAQKELNDKNEKLTTTSTKLDETLARLDETGKRLSSYLQEEQAVKFLSSLNQDERKVKKEPYLQCSVKIAPSSSSIWVTVEAKTYNGRLTIRDKDGGVISVEEPYVCKDKTGVFEAISKLRELSVLEIKDLQLDAKDLEAISKLQKVTHLYLVRCGLDDKIISHWKVGKNVKFLILNGNPLSILPNIPHKSAIVSLYLSRTKITDSAMQGFLADAANLHALKLDFTSITDKTIDAIEGKNTDLDNISLFRTAVTPDGLKRFIKRTKAKHVMLKLDKNLEPVYRQFLADNNLNTDILMTPYPAFEEDNLYKGGKAIWITKEKQK